MINILRFISESHRNDLFMSHNELLAIFNHGKECGLLLELDKWHHPDWQIGEGPANSNCLQRIAKAIETANGDEYHCENHFVNTHWSNWPDWPDHSIMPPENKMGDVKLIN